MPMLRVRTGLILIASLVVGCNNKAPEIPKPAMVEVKQCGVGDICIFRPPRKSGLAFISLQGLTKFRRLQAAHDPDPYGRFALFDDGLGWFDGKGFGATHKQTG